MLKLLFQKKDIREKILPFLSVDIFDSFEHKEITKKILSFIDDYNKFPTVFDMKLVLDNKEVFEEFKKVLYIDTNKYSKESLLLELESFFKKKLIWNVVTDIAEKLKDDGIKNISESPDQLRTSLSFSFDTQIGLDLFSDEERMFNHFNKKDKYIPSGLFCLDRLIGGGFHDKNLHLVLAATNTGKSLIKCSLASNAISKNKNVLYITLEMSEERIAERILQNIFDLRQSELKKLDSDNFKLKYKDIKEKIKNKLIIKEYPTKGANTNSFRNLLKELEIKKKFIPDIIFIDYLGIMTTNNIGKNDNTYTEGKKVSEEVRGLAVEIKKPIISSIQTNRKGIGSSDIDVDDVADSIGTAATADLIIGVTQSEELREQGKYCFIIIKNRFGLNKIKVIVGVDYEKMRIFDDGSNKLPDDNKNLNNLDNAKDVAKQILKNDKIETRKKKYDFT